MKIKLGDFYPRPEWGWSAEPGRRCHALASRVVQLQAGLGIAQVAAKHGDGTNIGVGIHHAEMAAEELVKGMPEQKPLVNAVKNRAKMLDTLIEPYRYERAKVPKKLAEAIEEQIKALEDYAFKLEGESIKSCGGALTGAHVSYNKEGKLRLPDLPKGMIAAAKKLRVEQEKKTAQRAERSYKKTIASMDKARKAKAKGKK